MASKTTKNPILLQKEHFTKDLKTGMPVEFYKEFYLLLLIYKSVKESYLVFVETLPNEPPPVWTSTDNSHNIIYAPHWYDLKSVFNKASDGLITYDVQSLRKGKMSYLLLTQSAKNNYTGQEIIRIIATLFGRAMEKNLVNFTLWDYNPTNDNTYGDHWNGEDFSIYSPLPKSKTMNFTIQTIISR
ncbi:6308_t:CDS:2 [Paraglomus brasilianum]|uniref:6308_t:CDS:1 n=1 Tax=Paraglomus brasilianum TaxID=144538 RepID=A0A9N8Z3H7_9GLOM|nr:6308_t:CDS:2 [Paraglomus brasilianum]